MDRLDFIRSPAIRLSLIFHFAYNRLLKKWISSDFIRDPAIPLASFFQFAYNRLLKERDPSILYALPRFGSPWFFNLRIRKLLKERITSILYAILRIPLASNLHFAYNRLLKEHPPPFYTHSVNFPTRRDGDTSIARMLPIKEGRILRPWYPLLTTLAFYFSNSFLCFWKKS